MSDNTTNLLLPFVLAAQAQKHVTVNEALRSLDGIVQLSVLDRNLTAPPGSPADGARYIVAAGATGAWSGWDGDVAMYVDGAWLRLVMRDGWVVLVVDEDRMFVRIDGALVPLLTSEYGSGGNGAFLRHGDGRLECWHTINLGSKIANGAGTLADPYRTGATTWTLPATFIAAPMVQVNFGLDTSTPAARAVSGSFRAVTTTSVTGICATAVNSDNTAVDVIAHLHAVGRWF